MKLKLHDLNNIIINCIEYKYFYTREKNDINGNSRFRVYIIDPDGPAVYERIIKTYEGLIKNYIKQTIEEVQRWNQHK